ncbi:MAG TPA: folylpolyglutamate synthase/dihydrofolate synthase family protein [Candidatus Lumbricidophila sp.]|nr:folylpolyglutamate synthase/dihydrofolate synthase family protein [Candidatus Lumbricidophila sp.]
MSAKERADAVYETLLKRTGEGNPAPRLWPTQRAVELLGDPHRAAPVVHLTGTNGKTTTSRIVASVLAAHGLRVGLLTSPHLERFTERIQIDLAPIDDHTVARVWDEIEPFIDLVDAELRAKHEPELTFFEALTVLALACFADAPVDVMVLEVGMGGAWDSTNVADADVAVFTPIDLDHQARLGSTIAEIAHTKAGIIKANSRVVSAAQVPDAANQLSARAGELGVALSVEPSNFAVLSTAPAVGGQVISVRGLAGEYRDLELPLHGAHQAQNAAVAIAAVEAFLGDGSRAIDAEVLQEGLNEVTSPGRLQFIAADPPVLVDAAHNPHGARALATALPQLFAFDEIGFVFGVLGDKDASGIVAALAPVATRWFITTPDSERATDIAHITATVRAQVDVSQTEVIESAPAAIEAARAWANAAPGRAVVVTGSVVLIGEALTLAKSWRDS